MDPQGLSNKLSLQYMQSLNDTIKLNGVPQIVQPYAVWNWGGNDYPMGSIPVQQVNYLNNVPNDPLLNSQTASGSAGTGFADNYSYFLNFINPTPQQPNKDYQALQQVLTNDTRKLYTTNQNATIAFNNFVKTSHSTETKAQWLANEGAPFQAQISAAQQKVQQDNAQLTNFANALKGPVAKAKTQYDNGLLQSQDQTGNPITVAGWTTDQTPYDYVNTITNNNPGGDAVAGSKRSFSISQDTGQYSNSRVYTQAKLGGFWSWFGIDAGGSFEQVDTSSFTSNYSVTFSFQDLTTIPITPGPWYSPAALTNYKQGPFFPGYSGFKSGNNVYYFGEDGNIARIYTAMVVGYRPKIDLNAGNSFASSFQQKVSAQATVWIGPFAFQGSGGSEDTKGSFEVNGADISAQGQGDWPYILALVSNWTVPPQ